MNNNEILLLKLGEVVLKGLNRRSFEDKLVSNVRRRHEATAAASRSDIRQSTIYVEPQTEDCDMEAAFKAARQVFGIVTVARAVPLRQGRWTPLWRPPRPIWRMNLPRPEPSRWRAAGQTSSSP